jgi:hypothetical protein
MNCSYRCIFISILVAFALPLHANWEVKGDVSITLTQAAYSNNWAGGETGSIAWTSNTMFTAAKQLYINVNNRNTLKLAFGQTYNQVKDTEEWIGPIKSTDLIDLESLFRLTLGAFVDPYAAGRIESQFYDDRYPDEGEFFNPALFTESLGAMKILFERDKLSWTARGGAALKQHVDRNVLDTLTDAYETELTNYGGLEFVTEFATPFAGGRMEYSSRLAVFKALFVSGADGANDEEVEYWQQPDLSWENLLTANIARYIVVNLYLELLYDKEIDHDIRFKQTLSFGLNFAVE